MKRTKTMALGMLAGTMVFASVSSAEFDEKTYPGSMCSFADNPLASHNKIHHRFKNTSSSWQWVTCPLIRDSSGSDGIRYAAAHIDGSSSSGRIEQYNTATGTLSGWNMSYASPPPVWYINFLNPDDFDVAITFEVYLAPDAHIGAYHMTEYNTYEETL